MKTLTLIISLLLTSTAFAGEVSMSSAAHLPAEQVSAASGTAGWVVPLLAITIIAIAAGSATPEVKKRPPDIICFPGSEFDINGPICAR